MDDMSSLPRSFLMRKATAFLTWKSVPCCDCDVFVLDVVPFCQLVLVVDVVAAAAAAAFACDAGQDSLFHFMLNNNTAQHDPTITRLSCQDSKHMSTICRTHTSRK
jgi:hypothetical protein